MALFQSGQGVHAGFLSQIFHHRPQFSFLFLGIIRALVSSQEFLVFGFWPGQMCPGYRMPASRDSNPGRSRTRAGFAPSQNNSRVIFCFRKSPLKFIPSNMRSRQCLGSDLDPCQQSLAPWQSLLHPPPVFPGFGRPGNRASPRRRSC